jgi:predicted DNA-binding mobile mystery protein A
MVKSNRKLLITQLDKKFSQFAYVKNVSTPSTGWIHAIRTALNMSLSQLGRRMGITPVSVSEIEQRESNKAITLRKLAEVAEALDCDFVYGFIPKSGSLDTYITERSQKIAEEIVGRTSQTMLLESQQNSQERLTQSIAERILEIKREIPKYLWD